MRLSAAVLLPGALLLALALAGCSSPVVARARPALAAAPAIETLAMLPLAPAGRLLERNPAPDRLATAPPEAPSLVAAKVSRQLAEALAARGVRVIPADDVSRALGLEGSEIVSSTDAARALHAEFGADSVMVGRVTRWVERSGEAAGSFRPASVAFEVTIHAAPGGAALWSATFDETQKPLSENVLRASQYPGGGLRWLSADELARWGAAELMRELPVGP